MNTQALLGTGNSPASQSHNYLAEAFRIGTGQLPLKPERAHLTALRAHFCAWTGVIMEEATPRPPRETIRCQNEGCESGWVTAEDGQRSECPVCDGDPEIDFGTVASYARQIDQLREHNRELQHKLRVAQNEIAHRDMLAAQAERLEQLQNPPGNKPAQKQTGTVLVMQGVS